jgi:hypothetical protein
MTHADPKALAGIVFKFVHPIKLKWRRFVPKKAKL